MIKPVTDRLKVKTQYGFSVNLVILTSLPESLSDSQDTPALSSQQDH